MVSNPFNHSGGESNEKVDEHIRVGNADSDDMARGVVPDEDSHNHLHRGLKARQITMIAIGGAIGTGLIIGT